jgi:hypothetical protein
LRRQHGADVVGVGALERGACGGDFRDDQAGFGHAAQDGAADFGFAQQIGGQTGFSLGQNVQDALPGRRDAGLRQRIRSAVQHNGLHGAGDDTQRHRQHVAGG